MSATLDSREWTAVRQRGSHVLLVPAGEAKTDLEAVHGRMLNVDDKTVTTEAPALSFLLRGYWGDVENINLSALLADAEEVTLPDPQWLAEVADDQTANTVRANADYQYSINEFVTWNGKRGIVIEQHAADFTYDGEKISVDDGEVKYVVAHEDGTSVVSESALESSDWHTEVQNPDEDDIKKADKSNTITTNFYDALGGDYHSMDAILGANIAGDTRVRTNDIGFDDWPPSWEKADAPARLIALRAWAAMGGTFSGCRQELNSARLCAAFKDEIYQTTEWRGGD